MVSFLDFLYSFVYPLDSSSLSLSPFVTCTIYVPLKEIYSTCYLGTDDWVLECTKVKK